MSIVHELEHAARPERNRMSEDALLRAYGESPSLLAAPAPRRCSCGDLIAPASEGAIPDAVRAHNETPRHVEWAYWRGLR